MLSKVAPFTLHFVITDKAAARMASVKRFPGEQYISEAGALALIKRGTFRACVTDKSDERFFDEPSDSEEVRFRHDPKLTLPSYTYLTHEQVLRISIATFLSMFACSQ